MVTINDLERSLQDGIEALRNTQLNAEASLALELLLPEGLLPVVECVQENGRRKRGNAASWNWNPQSDRIVISFRPSRSSTQGPNFSAQSPLQPKSAPESAVPVMDEVSAQEIIECCQSLNSAEKSNRQFIAIKWFRDDFLATVDYAWAKSPQRRQRVISHAIDIGRIEARKIPNPKSPQFPTTTISLNRSVPIPGILPRFQPVTIRGEAASATLLRDRGNA